MKFNNFFIVFIFFFALITIRAQVVPEVDDIAIPIKAQLRRPPPTGIDQKAEYPPNKPRQIIEQIDAAQVPQYQLRRLSFQINQIIGDPCNKCKQLQYYAFRIGNKYLAADPVPTFNVATSPATGQLWRAFENFDGTWSFQSKTTGRYLMTLPGGVGVGYTPLHTLNTRWYIERHGDHLHIQSGNILGRYWVFGSAFQLQLSQGATALIIQHWPDRKWLWNF